MDKLKIYATFSVAAAICYLATSLVLATLEIGKVREQLPQIITQLETVESGLDIPGILEIISRVDARLPGILEEVASVRQSVDGVSNQIPGLVAEVAAVRQQTVPAVLQESQAIRSSIPPVLQESKAIRELVPGVLGESASIRKALPGTLDRTDAIVEKLGNVGENLTENVTRGTVKSILSAPIDIIEGVVGPGASSEKSEKDSANTNTHNKE